MSPHLSLDIQLEIIKKLPVKSLIQFRSVCKAWKSLIESSKFIVGYNVCHDHLLMRYQVGGWKKPEVKYVSFVDDDDDSFPQQKFALTVPPLVQTKATRIIDSSHGLLCLTDYLEEPDDSSETQMVVLWNPAIRKSIDVVLPNPVHGPFDYVVGFGVCPDTKDPKLVKITYIIDCWRWKRISSIPCQVMVFTLSSGEWTNASCSNLPCKSIAFTWSQTVIGQFIYWIAHDMNYVDGGFRKLIVSFDMSTEEFREVNLPDSLAEMHESDLYVHRLRESLAVVEYVFEDLTWKRVCSVWMMDVGGSKAFTKLFTINSPYTSVSKTIGFRKSGEPIVEICDDYSDFDKPSSLVVYEPWSEHIKDLGIRGNIYSFSLNSYTESLLLLDHDDGHIVRSGASKK